MFDNIRAATAEYASKMKDIFVADLSVAHVDLSNAIVALNDKRHSLVSEAFATITGDEAALNARLVEIKGSVDAEIHATINAVEERAAEVKSRLFNGFEAIHTKQEEILRILRA